MVRGWINGFMGEWINGCMRQKNIEYFQLYNFDKDLIRDNI